MFIKIIRFELTFDGKQNHKININNTNFEYSK